MNETKPRPHPWFDRITRLLYPYTVNGRENIPEAGPFIVVSNHMSETDGVYLARTFNWKITFLIIDWAFRLPVIGRLLMREGHIPVDQHDPTSRDNPASGANALSRAEALLRQGHIVGLYPEGCCYAGTMMGPYQLGMVRLALRTGAPIIPVGTKGTVGGGFNWRTLRPFRSVELVIGEPVKMNGRKFTPQNRREVIAEVEKALAILSGRDIFDPDRELVYSK